MQYRYGVYRVFAVNGDHLGMHELKTGDRVGDRMEILDGVKLGEQVALTDVDNLADGMKVTVAKGDLLPQARRTWRQARRPRSKRDVGVSRCCLNCASGARSSRRCSSCRWWCSGIFSFRDLGVDLFPRADPATVNVSLRLPGAAPDEMTSAVIMPMENALSGIAGIDQMSATISAGGTATITVRFLLERDLDDAANSVREKVAGAMRSVPPEVLPPIIQKQDPDADPIMSTRARRASRRACARSPRSPTSRSSARSSRSTASATSA